MERKEKRSKILLKLLIDAVHVVSTLNNLGEPRFNILKSISGTEEGKLKIISNNNVTSIIYKVEENVSIIIKYSYRNNRGKDWYILKDIESTLSKVKTEILETINLREVIPFYLKHNNTNEND